jgi:hypothetical protein
LIETLEETGYFAPPRRPRRRAFSFAASAALHSAVSFLLVGIQWAPETVYTPAAPKNYSVRWLQLQVPDIRPYIPAAPVAQQTAMPANRLPQVPRPVVNSSVVNPIIAAPNVVTPAVVAPGVAMTVNDLPAPVAPPVAPPVKTPRVARQFEPPAVKRPPSNQTLVQLDVPADVVPLPNIPLPTAVFWSQPNQKRLPIARLAAPPAKLPTPVRNPPARPTIDAPNAELAAADVQLASAIVNNRPALPQFPGVTAPVRTPGDPGDQLPQTPLPPSNEQKSPNLVSLPETPVLAREVIIIPPANQVAPASAAGGGAGGSGAGGSVAGSGGTAAPGAKAATAPAAGSSQPNAAPNGSGQSASSQIGPGVSDFLASLKRIVLPKDGKFGAVVMGSSATGPYSEAQGALSGKILYTVYLRVGLRKNWIMQFGVPKAVERVTAAKGSTTELEAPWPQLILTPANATLLDHDYIILRGVLNTKGKFEQLQMIAPRDYPGRELLIATLEIWEFRPAKKDGEDTAVEVLLIIPRQEG